MAWKESEMSPLLPIRILFTVGGLYDGLLGLSFLVAAPRIYTWMGITPPNHWGYIHFPAGILVIFGIMFLAIAARPVENRNLIVYGVLLKVCYVGTVAWHATHGGIPAMWTYFAVADTAFALLFVWSLVRLRTLKA
jgi:hypothetical protein